MLKHIKIRSDEMGLYFHEGEFRALWGPGTRWLFDPLKKANVQVVSQRDPWLVHEKLDMIVKSGVLKDLAVVLDLKDYERGLVWIEGRFSHVLPPGLYAYWIGHKNVRVEVVDARSVRFEHSDFKVIVKSPMVQRLLDICAISRNSVGVLFQDGHFVATLPAGQYAFWKDVADSRIVEIDLREKTIDVCGQDMMTSDKVTLRLNAVTTYRVANPKKAVTETENVEQALYREVQLALRALDRFQGVGRVLERQGCGQQRTRIGGSAAGRGFGFGAGFGRHPGRDPAGRDEGSDEQGHGGQEGGGSQPDRPPGGNGGHPQSGQHRQAVGG